MPNTSSSSAKVYYPPHSREELTAKLRAALPALARALTLRRVVLFGSWATGRATAFSDIDLLVVYAGPPRADAYKLVRAVIGLRGLEAHVYTESEAEALRPTLERMTRDGIDLLAP
jgi:predicted nucleotidyltransferase